MHTWLAPIVRIVLRYLSGFLVAAGFLVSGTDLSTDPEIVNLVVSGIGAIVGIATELWYKHARKVGGPT